MKQEKQATKERFPRKRRRTQEGTAEQGNKGKTEDTITYPGIPMHWETWYDVIKRFSVRNQKEKTVMVVTTNEERSYGFDLLLQAYNRKHVVHVKGKWVHGRLTNYMTLKEHLRKHKSATSMRDTRSASTQERFDKRWKALEPWLREEDPTKMGLPSRRRCIGNDVPVSSRKEAVKCGIPSVVVTEEGKRTNTQKDRALYSRELEKKHFDREASDRMLERRILRVARKDTANK
jgi:hypothetical protein